MVRVLFLLALVIGSVPLVAAPAQDAALLAKLGLTVLAEKPLAPDFRLENLAGGQLRLSDLRGRYVVLNFWTTWCGPCREEIPSLDGLTTQLAGPKLAVVAVDVGETKAVVTPFLAKIPHRFTVVLDPDQEVAQRYGIEFVPLTYLIDPQGRLVAAKQGAFVWDGPVFLDGLRSILR